MKKTLRFEATLTIVPLYGSNVDSARTASTRLKTIGLAWQEAATKVCNNTGIYVDATINASRVLNKIGLGCSYGGNLAFTLSGTLNPLFYDPAEWQDAVLAVIRNVNEIMKNTNITVDFWEVNQESIG